MSKGAYTVPACQYMGCYLYIYNIALTRSLTLNSAVKGRTALHAPRSLSPNRRLQSPALRLAGLARARSAIIRVAMGRREGASAGNRPGHRGGLQATSTVASTVAMSVAGLSRLVYAYGEGGTGREAVPGAPSTSEERGAVQAAGLGEPVYALQTWLGLELGLGLGLGLASG